MLARRYSSFAIVVSGALLLNRVFSPLVQTAYSWVTHSQSAESSDSQRAAFLHVCSEAENCFALGLKLPFAAADDYALQLIPRISDAIASDLLAQRERIYERSARLSLDDEWRAFTEARGVGDALAMELSKHFSLRRRLDHHATIPQPARNRPLIKAAEISLAL